MLFFRILFALFLLVISAEAQFSGAPTPTPTACPGHLIQAAQGNVLLSVNNEFSSLQQAAWVNTTNANTCASGNSGSQVIASSASVNIPNNAGTHWLRLNALSVSDFGIDPNSPISWIKLNVKRSYINNSSVRDFYVGLVDSAGVVYNQNLAGCFPGQPCPFASAWPGPDSFDVKSYTHINPAGLTWSDITDSSNTGFVLAAFAVTSNGLAATALVDCMTVDICVDTSIVLPTSTNTPTRTPTPTPNVDCCFDCNGDGSIDGGEVKTCSDAALLSASGQADVLANICAACDCNGDSVINTQDTNLYVIRPSSCTGETSCCGDCDRDGTRDGYELRLCEEIYFGRRSLSECPYCDCNSDGQVQITDLTSVVNAGSEPGCETDISCCGDCDSSGTVNATEVGFCNSIAVATKDAMDLNEFAACPQCDCSSDGYVSIVDLTDATNNRLFGCNAPTPTQTYTRTITPTLNPLTPTLTRTRTPTPSFTTTSTVSLPTPICCGDCNFDQEVTDAEKSVCVGILELSNSYGECPSCDCNSDGNVTQSDVLKALNPQTNCFGASLCCGDCNVDGTVTANEAFLCSLIASGQEPLTECISCDCNGDGNVTTAEAASVVGGSCLPPSTSTKTLVPNTPTPAPTVTITPGAVTTLYFWQGAPPVLFSGVSPGTTLWNTFSPKIEVYMSPSKQGDTTESSLSVSSAATVNHLNIWAVSPPIAEGHYFFPGDTVEVVVGARESTVTGSLRMVHTTWIVSPVGTIKCVLGPIGAIDNEFFTTNIAPKVVSNKVTHTSLCQASVGDRVVLELGFQRASGSGSMTGIQYHGGTSTDLSDLEIFAQGDNKTGYLKITSQNKILFGREVVVIGTPTPTKTSTRTPSVTPSWTPVPSPELCMESSINDWHETCIISAPGYGMKSEEPSRSEFLQEAPGAFSFDASTMIADGSVCFPTGYKSFSGVFDEAVYCYNPDSGVAGTVQGSVTMPREYNGGELDWKFAFIRGFGLFPTPANTNTPAPTSTGTITTIDTPTPTVPSSIMMQSKYARKIDSSPANFLSSGGISTCCGWGQPPGQGAGDGPDVDGTYTNANPKIGSLIDRSPWLVGRDFGFTIPDGATILGIQFVWEAKTTGSDDDAYGYKWIYSGSAWWTPGSIAPDKGQITESSTLAGMNTQLNPVESLFIVGGEDTLFGTPPNVDSLPNVWDAVEINDARFSWAGRFQSFGTFTSANNSSVQVDWIVANVWYDTQNISTPTPASTPTFTVTPTDTPTGTRSATPTITQTPTVNPTLYPPAGDWAAKFSCACIKSSYDSGETLSVGRLNVDQRDLLVKAYGTATPSQLFGEVNDLQCHGDCIGDDDNQIRIYWKLEYDPVNTTVDSRNFFLTDILGSFDIIGFGN